MKPTRLISVLALTAGAIAVVGIALTVGGPSLEVAKFAVPHQLALKTAQIGFLAPAAQAAPIESGAGYLPAHFAGKALVEEPLPPQF